MFADVFTDSSKISELDAILKKGQEKNPEEANNIAKELLERVSKLDKAGDIFADISKKARKDKETNANNSLANPHSEAMERTELTKEISKHLKNGPGIMMKIASRWADAEVVKSSPSKEERCQPSPIKTFESEQSSLLKEMADIEKGERLKRFTQVNYDEVEDVTNNNSDAESSPTFSKIESEIEEKQLKKIGAKSVEAETYKTLVLEKDASIGIGSKAPTCTAPSAPSNDEKCEENVVYICSRLCSKWEKF